jgi:hypothetical protein
MAAHGTELTAITSQEQLSDKKHGKNNQTDVKCVLPAK